MITDLHYKVPLYFTAIIGVIVGISSNVCGEDPDMGDHAKFAHAMRVETRDVHGLPCVFHYGEVRPDFQSIGQSKIRRTTLLSGDWKFRFDPASQGSKDQWFGGKHHTANGWQDVRVPHCWDAMPGGRYWDWSDRSVTNPPHYDGAAWYRKTFTYKPEEKKRQRIVFLGVQQRARVYLNGKEIAMHEGGGAPFSVNVSKHLVVGENLLALKVLRLPNYRKKPGGSGWQEIDYVHTMHPKAPDCWPYAGILRDVFLIEESAVSIRRAFVHVSGDDLKAAVVVSNQEKSERNFRVRFTTPSRADASMLSETTTIKAGATKVVRFSWADAAKGVEAWSPSNPKVYQAMFVLENANGVSLDDLPVRYGKRRFVTRGNQFRLNGKPCFLKGASVYAEHPKRGGALVKTDHEAYFDRLVETRSNFVRLHVSQRHPYVHQLADQRGVMVCGEWGGFWYREKAMEAQTRDRYSIYQTMARCAVWDLMNHPSVVMWGLNNECHQFCPEYEPFLKMSRDLVREIDFQKRPITWAAWHPHMGQPHFEHADAVGFNEYRGAMDPFEKLDPDMKKVTQQNPNKPVIIMENGAWSKRGSRGPVGQKNNENWQADLLKRQWEVLSKHSPPFSGYTYWLLQDYRSRKPYTGKKSSNGYSRMGIYDEFGKPKLLVREAFTNLPNPLKKQSPKRD